MTLFDKIINREIPATIIYEDNDVIAFLDISQTTKGHTLVVPKRHATSFLDCQPDSLSKVMLVAQRLANQIKDNLNANGINILMNCDEAAGQSIPHFHVHIIPRYDENDGFSYQTLSQSSANLAEIKELILKKTL